MSSKRSGNAPLFGGVILLVLVAGFAAMNAFSPSQGGGPLEEIPEGIPTNPIDTQTKIEEPTAELTVPPVLVLVRDGNVTRIVRREQGQADRTLFTDSDESQKIQQIVGLGQDRVYALVSADANGPSKVASITLNGSGKLEMLSEALLSSSVPAVRPDGQRLALVSFDNAERSFGFTLKTQTLTGTGEKTIDSNESGIALPRWSIDGTQLAFAKGQATPEDGQEIRVASNEENPQTIYTTEKNVAVTDMAWAGSSELLIVLEPLGNETQNQAKLVRLSISNKTASDLVDVAGKERGLATSPDAAFVGFVGGTVPAGTSLPAGTVTIQSLSGTQSTTLGQAVSVIGWAQ